MKKLFLLIMLMILLPTAVPAQDTHKPDSLSAFNTGKIIKGAMENAQKGLFWAMENIPVKKQSLESDLIAEDKLISLVRLEKGENGIRFESTGYFETCEVRIRIFKSNDRLLSEGYLKSDTTAQKPEKVKKN